LAISIVTDLRSRLILNVVTYPALVLILISIFWVGGWPQLVNSLIGIAIAAGPIFLSCLITIRGQQAMSLGDVKLMAVAGAASGWPPAVGVIMYVSIAGGLQALLWIVVAKVRGQPKPDYVPYGVAIAAGTVA